MCKDSPLGTDFAGTELSPHLAELQSWQSKGYTDIVLFGRFQPPHRGHRALLETLRASGLNVNLILNDKTDDIEGERNPFNAHQREAMVRLSMPWLPAENIQHATVYLGGGGDVGNGVRRLTGIFNGLSDQGKLVFAYFEKAEDRKTYLVDGQTITGAHYVELVGAPRGTFPIQRITPEMINEVSDYVKIDAKMFRNKALNGDDKTLDSSDICYELLDPAVAEYVSEQIELAERNGRLVGADPSGDSYTLAQLRADRASRGPEFIEQACE